jgi:hypothetical protein
MKKNEELEGWKRSDEFEKAKMKVISPLLGPLRRFYLLVGV